MALIDARHHAHGSGRPEGQTLWTAATAALLVAIGFVLRDGLAPRRSDPGRSGPDDATPAAALERGRGRWASKPSDIPARGWKDILKRTFARISESHLIAIAAGVTFYAILAIFPGIAALVALYGLFADPAVISQHVDTLAGVLPGGGIEVIRDETNRVAAQGRTTLGLASAIGLGVSLWSAKAGMKAMLEALNIAYGEEEKRGFFKLNALSLTFTLGAVLFLIAAMLVLIVLPNVLSYLGLERQTELLVKVLRWPALLLVVSFALAVLYRYGPSRTEAQWRWITWGSALAALGWLAVSLLFSWYAENFGSYNKTYGALGAVIGFMTWLWLSSIVVLIGAVLDAEMEHQTVRDTTTHAPKPMGTRGARMADTVGASQT